MCFYNAFRRHWRALIVLPIHNVQDFYLEQITNRSRGIHKIFRRAIQGTPALFRMPTDAASLKVNCHRFKRRDRPQSIIMVMPFSPGFAWRSGHRASEIQSSM
jgi:hypothetical protein|tara:strand:- start:435 stop:743 length:309 start_codon:yes stop_codon:yes gene_type:complete